MKHLNIWKDIVFNTWLLPIASDLSTLSVIRIYWISKIHRRSWCKVWKTVKRNKIVLYIINSSFKGLIQRISSKRYLIHLKLCMHLLKVSMLPVRCKVWLRKRKKNALKTHFFPINCVILIRYLTQSSTCVYCMSWIYSGHLLVNKF